MMKKLTAFLMALCMLLSVVAFAESPSSPAGSTIANVTWNGDGEEWVILTPIEELAILVENAKKGIQPTNRNTPKENREIYELLLDLIPQTAREVADAYSVTDQLEAMVIPGHSIDDLALVTGGSLRVSKGLVGQKVAISMEVAGIAEGDWAAILLIPYEGKASVLVEPTVITGKDTAFEYVPAIELYTIVVIKDIAEVAEAEDYAIEGYESKY